MTLADLDLAPPSAVVALAGLREGSRCHAGIYAAPCPICSAERAHTRKGRADKRLAILVRYHGAVTCCACGVSMSRADLVAHARHGRAWRALDASERAACLDAPAPAPAPPVEPPRRLDVALWAALTWACVPAYQDRECVAWATSRGLHLPPDALAVVGDADADLPLWTSGGHWLPDLGARLLLPAYDGEGWPRGARLRNVRGGPIKEQAIRGYSATGLLYAPLALRERWRAGGVADRPALLVEGGPDRMAAGWSWREAHVCGLWNGSWGNGASWLRRLGSEVWFIHQEDAPDQHGKRAGQEYARRLELLIPGLRLVGVSRVFELAGVPWTEGEDLADLARRSALPRWDEVARIRAT